MDNRPPNEEEFPLDPVRLLNDEHKAHLRQIREAVTAFYGAVIDWVGADKDPPQKVLDASYAIQRLTDPEGR